MKKLLIVLPSRGRPEKLKLALDSYIKTTDGTHSEVLVCLDNDDKKIDQYKSLLKEYSKDRINYKISRRPTPNKDVYCITRIINRAFYWNSDRDFYCVTNDDIVYETNDWDKKMSNEWAITTGKEPNMQKKYGKWIGNTPVAGFPIISVIDGRICRLLDWLQMPELDGCCGDNCWFWIGIHARNLLYLDDVVYVHNHYIFGESEMDDTYKPVYDNDNVGAREDYKRFIDWAKYRAKRQITQIKDMIEENIGKKKEE